MKYHLVAGALAGEIYVAEDNTKAIVGAALWFGPGQEAFDRYI